MAECHVTDITRHDRMEALARDVGYRPSTDLERGVKQFVEWYLGYYHPQP